MTTPRSASSLAAKFLRESVKVDGPPPSPQARDAAIVAIERAIAARSRRKRAMVILSVGGGVAAAAIVVLGVFKLMPILHTDETVAASGTSVPMLAHPVTAGTSAGATVVGANKADPTKAMPLQEGALVSHGQRVTTPADAKIVFAHVTGTELTLNGGSEMSVIEDDQNRIYSLGKGTLDLRVAKLKPNERLLVRTSDAEVEVRGTRFHVEVLDPATSCDRHSTRVSVDEGVVVVRRDGAEARLTAGQSWPTCAQPSQTQTPTQMQGAAQAQGAPTLGTPQDPGQSPAVVSPSSALSPQAPATAPVPGGNGAGAQIAPAGGSGGSAGGSGVSSTLQDQNDLFADGIDKRHQGDMAGAAAAFERLLTKYPQSPLAESASAERLKALKASNPERAKVAAKEYLRRWPRGFARDEAESVLREAP